MSDLFDPKEQVSDIKGAPDSRQPAPRILALDLGDRRIGLAITDALGYTAQPLFTLYRTNLRADLKSIARIIHKHSVSEVVVGLPLHASGSLSPQAMKAQTFADSLQQEHPTLRLHLLDERLTTADAHTLLDGSHLVPRSRVTRKKRSAIVDQVAAVLLLEAFLSTSAPVLLPPPHL